jgi:hypothetical protein
MIMNLSKLHFYCDRSKEVYISIMLIRKISVFIKYDGY